MKRVIFIQPLLQWQRDRELGLQLFFKPRDIPLLLYTHRGNVGLHRISDHIEANSGNRLGDICFGQQVITLLIDYLTLIVGNVIVFQ